MAPAPSLTQNLSFAYFPLIVTEGSFNRALESQLPRTHALHSACLALALGSDYVTKLI